MYAVENYKTKKALKAAVADPDTEVRIFQYNDIFGNPEGAPDYTGTSFLEGPHYPEPHRWYAQVDVVDGKVVKVK